MWNFTIKTESKCPILVQRGAEFEKMSGENGRGNWKLSFEDSLVKLWQRMFQRRPIFQIAHCQFVMKPLFGARISSGGYCPQSTYDLASIVIM